MQHSWLKNVFPIAAVFSFRMLGLFMLIPVFTVYAVHLDAATPTLIGIALGSYGLSQGLLQIPFGLLSDRFGRKPIITLGLLLLVCGSLLGAMTHSIYGMILARTLQGTGAIGSVLIALLADITPDTQRTKAMAIIGTSIGLSFSLSMVISPAITHLFGLAGIFYFTAILAILGLLLLHLVIPTPIKETFHVDSEPNPKLFKQIIANPHLQRLNIGIFCQHFILTSTFFVLPMLLQQQIHQDHLSTQWRFYLPLMVFSFLAMVPFIIIAEKKQLIKEVFITSVVITILSQLLLAFTHLNWLSICVSSFGYFVAFNILEATLPSLVSRQANTEGRGTAMGIYSSCQFIGIFAGGASAGLLYQFSNTEGIFILNTIIGVLWLCLTIKMQPAQYRTVIHVNVSTSLSNTDELVRQLKALPGVINVTFASNDGGFQLQIHKATYQAGSAEQLLQEALLEKSSKT